MMSESVDWLPPVTFVVEWENAIDVDDDWTKKAMVALQRELERCRPRFRAKPRLMYLYDQNAVREATIRDMIDQVAPRLREVADVEMVPTPGLTYYKLKNLGVSRSQTEITIMVDSDAGPRSGWLDGLLAPFADPEIMAVGGFTVLGHDDLLSRTMALSWIFNLESERAKTVKREKIHVNNCAVRTDFFRAHPFPDLEGAFKKQCGFWLRDLKQRGFKWKRTADAMTVHAPHPGGAFIVWRFWTIGTDRDFQAYHTVTKSRLGRLGYAFFFFAKKLMRSWRRIWTKGGEVGLPVWQRPIAMLISLTFYLVTLSGELYSAALRRFAPLPETVPLVAVGAAAGADGSAVAVGKRVA